MTIEAKRTKIASSDIKVHWSLEKEVRNEEGIQGYLLIPCFSSCHLILDGKSVNTRRISKSYISRAWVQGTFLKMRKMRFGELWNLTEYLWDTLYQTIDLYLWSENFASIVWDSFMVEFAW